MQRRDFVRLSAAWMMMPAWAPAAGARGGADFSWLNARLRDRVERGYFDGMGLIIGRGETVLHEAYLGNSTAATVTHVASTGKWTAVAAIASLVDDGTLAWNDPVNKFLPEFSDVKGGATLRQLLSHTAGYPDYQPAGSPPDSSSTLAASVARIVDLPAVAEPGRIFQYGGLAMQVAGRMAELASGQDFETLFRTRIAEPLGMTRSGYTPVSPEPGFSPMLGGSLFTSTGDYGRFLMMISQDGRFRGRSVLSQAVVRQMQSDQVRGARVKPLEFVEQARADPRQDIYGLGEWREEADGAGRATLISSPGWAGAYAWLDKAHDVWGFVLAKANVGAAVADGYSTFLGSSIYAPMVRTALDDAHDHDVRRGRIGGMYYEERGSGEAVIFLHGHTFDRRQWEPQFAALANTHRVIRYDLRGYGRSEPPPGGTDSLHANDLRLLMDGLGLRTAHLVGLSLGGFVVTDFLALFPHRVAGAVMAGGDLQDAAGASEPYTIVALKKKGLFAWKRDWFEELISTAGSGAAALRRSLWRMIDEWPAWQIMNVEPRTLLGRETRARLAQTKPTAPLLIIRGDHERLGFELQQLLPQSQLKIIPDCGRVSNLERPAQFSALLRNFLGGASKSRG